LFGGAYEGPADGGCEELGGGLGGGVLLQAVEEHFADYGDDGGLEVGFEVRLAGAGEVRGLGEEVADS